MYTYTVHLIYIQKNLQYIVCSRER